MKRLIGDKKQNLLENLSKSIAVDDEGNIEVGGNAEVDGKLTINSASDLVTKDGSSVGGDPNFIFHIPFERFTSNATGDKFSATFTTEEKEKYEKSGLVSIENEGIPFIILSKSDGGDTNTGSSSTEITGIIGTFDSVTSVYLLTIAIVKHSSDSQSTLYRHTVTITNGTAKAYACFTAESEKNTVIDSVQDLIAVFGSTKLAISGYKHSDDTSKYALLRLDIGTAIDSTKVQFAEMSAGEMIGLGFTAIFGASGFTITDSVTAM